MTATITADSIAQQLISKNYLPSKLYTADSRAIGQAVQNLTFRTHELKFSFHGNSVQHGFLGSIKDFGVTITRPDGDTFSFTVGATDPDIRQKVTKAIPEQDGTAAYELLEALAAWINGYGKDFHFMKQQARIISLFDSAKTAEEAIAMRNSIEGISGGAAMDIYKQAKGGETFAEAWEKAH